MLVLKTVYIAVENNQDPAFYIIIRTSRRMGKFLESRFDPFMNPSYLPAVANYTVRNSMNVTYTIMPGMMGADTYDAFYIAKDAVERAGTVDKAAVQRCNRKQLTWMQSLILTESGKIQFSTGVNYHEIEAQ